MLRPDNLFQIFGIIILLLMSIGLISYTTKYIFGVGQTKRATKIPDEIYDREHKQNKTQICPFADDSYRVKFEESPCFNKTMLHWYVPWTKHGVWIRFRKKIEERKRTEEMKRRQAEEEARKNTTTIEKKPEEPAAPPENSTNQKVQEKPPKVVYTILAALLVLSSTFACLEVFRGKFRRKDAADVKAEQRRYSLADFTINRHLRRESQQANMQHIQRQASFDHPAKVTPNLVHQGSLDRAISKLNSEGKRCLLRIYNASCALLVSLLHALGEMHKTVSSILKIFAGGQHFRLSNFKRCGDRQTSKELELASDSNF